MIMRRSISFAVAAFGILAGPHLIFAQAPNANRSVVLATVQAFHSAIERGDSVTALQQLAPDVQVQESGGVETLAEFRSHHLAADITYAKTVPSDRAEPTVVVSGDVAWVIGTSRSTGSYRGRAINSAGAELMVLSRTADGWRIRAIHWSSRAIRTP
jgi:ketosteroid isomerase-like protein